MGDLSKSIQRLWHTPAKYWATAMVAPIKCIFQIKLTALTVAITDKIVAGCVVITTPTFSGHWHVETSLIKSGDNCLTVRGFQLKDRVFLRKIQKMHLFPENWMNRTTNGTIRKCFTRAFQWMVMSVGSDNL
jgi:hypothetical protein